MGAFRPRGELASSALCLYATTRTTLHGLFSPCAEMHQFHRVRLTCQLFRSYQLARSERLAGLRENEVESGVFPILTIFQKVNGV